MSGTRGSAIKARGRTGCRPDAGSEAEAQAKYSWYFAELVVEEQNIAVILEKSLLLDETSNNQPVLCSRLHKKANLWLRFACGDGVERGRMLKQGSKYHRVDA